jgi:myo-inositol-1(or 4)-monophosphatase
MQDNMLSKYLDFMRETAYLAGRITLGYFNTNFEIDYKADKSPVTEADKKAEELIRGRIERTYPNQTIIGEEFGENHHTDSSQRWFIDPIDGTKSFICGVPLYSVLLGLEIDGVMEAGVAYFPALDEMISAANSLGCWWNGRRSFVSKVDDLKKATVAFTSTALIEQYNRSREWDRLIQGTYYQAGWGDAYGYLLVATGRVEVMVDPVMNEWDCAPFPPILREAGGYFGDWNGNRTIYAKEGLATTEKLLPSVLALTSR